MTACARCETALEAGDLRCAICALPVPVTVRPGDAAPYAQVLRCGDCGAAIGFSADVQAPRCGFCGQAMAIEQPSDPIETAQSRLPFTVDRTAAEAAARGWLARRGWFAPPALARDAVLESLTPLAWAAWRVSAEAEVAWTADSDAGAERSAWAPHAGRVALAFRDVVVPASRGLTARECRRLLPYYALPGAVAIDAAASADAAADAAIESFDLQRSAARQHVQRAIEATARVRVQPHIPGRRYRNVRVACLVERQTTERIALPAWILTYRYRGAAYRAIIHGQCAALVFGRPPLDRAKLAWLVAILAALAAAVFVLAIRS
jgi:hypothetical protein